MTLKINNQELKKEIIKNKNQLCWFAEPRYEQYDRVVELRSSVRKEGLVYRVWSETHIPEGRNIQRLRFRPFKHFIKQDGRRIEVARSHWKGDLESGEFSERHEPMTEELQLIYNSMTAHVAKARNWRDYSRVEEWQWFAFFRLVETSGLRFNEERNNPSGYYYRAINTDFLRCLNKFKEELDIDKLNAMSERVIMKSSFQGVY